MKKNMFYFLLVAIFISTSAVAAQKDDAIQKETLIYSIKGTDTLRLDKYDLPSLQSEKPCLIFAFGGGFVKGNRDAERYIPFFNELAKSGYTVVSIDYRLGMKNAGKAGLGDPMEFVSLFKNTISIAIEDLFDATSFVVGNADKWNVDKDIIIACGSSAGAIAVLQGEYEICNNSKLTDKLPANFNYAGVISFAGAIFTTDGDLQWNSKPAPIQFFHGDGDKNVPYDKVEMGKLGFYGSKYIAKQLSAISSPYYFYDVENAAHEMADIPMSQNLPEIKTFLDKLVIEKQALIIHTKVEQLGKPILKKDFQIMDYIQSNFGS